MNTDAPRNDTGTRRRLLALAAAALGVAGGLLVAEVTLRILVKVELLSPDKNRYARLLNDIENGSLYRASSDPDLGYEFIPGSRRNLVRINADGLRGRALERAVPPGTTRIAILGDSESVGLMLAEEDTLPGSLERALNDRRDGKAYEVLDFGVPGYNIDQKARILERVLSYRPAAVILYYVFNDCEPSLNRYFFDDSPLLRSHLYVLLRYSASLVRPTAYQIAHRNGSVVNYFQQLHASPEFDRCVDQIERIGETLHERGIRFIVVIAPELLGYGDFTSYPHRNIHDKLRALASRNIEVFDPLDELAASGFAPVDLWATPFDCHKGKTANAIIARSIADHLSAGERESRRQ